MHKKCMNLCCYMQGCFLLKLLYSSKKSKRSCKSFDGIKGSCPSSLLIQFSTRKTQTIRNENATNSLAHLSPSDLF